MERLTNIWLPQTDTEGGTHRTERLTNIDMVGGWARQTQRRGHTGLKDLQALIWSVRGSDRHRGGTHRTERLTNKDIVQNPYGGWVGGSFRKYYHFVAPSCKLELARFSA